MAQGFDRQCNYGYCSERGIAFAKNDCEAARCSGLSADQGDSEGQRRDGPCLEKWIDIPRKDLPVCDLSPVAQFRRCFDCRMRKRLYKVLTIQNVVSLLVLEIFVFPSSSQS
jgi:hypothetical protein